jgi:hypothetical protein
LSKLDFHRKGAPAYRQAGRAQRNQVFLLPSKGTAREKALKLKEINLCVLLAYRDRSQTRAGQAARLCGKSDLE